MIKTITYLCLLLVLIAGCSEDKKEPLTDYSLTEDLNVFKYKFFNLDGIDLSEEFIDIYNGKVISFSDGGKLEYLGDGGLSIIGNEAYDYWGALWNNTYNKLRFSEYRPDDSKFLYMSGVRGNKIWVGKFDESKKEQVDEWYCNKEISNGRIKYDVGYGKEESIEVKSAEIKEVAEEYFLLRIVRPDNMKSIDLALMKSNLYGHCFESIYHIQKWFNKSYLIGTSEFSNIYDDEGEWIIKYGKMLRSYNSNIPVSYAKYLSCNRTYIMLDDITEGSNIWITPTPFAYNYPDGTKMRYELIEKTSNQIWKLLCTALKIDSTEDKIVFTINMENGDIVVL